MNQVLTEEQVRKLINRFVALDYQTHDGELIEKIPHYLMEPFARAVEQAVIECIKNAKESYENNKPF